jgi:hypothetical protein
MKEANDNVDAFYEGISERLSEAWKDYRRRFPVAKEADQPGDIDGDIMQQFFDGAEPNSASQDSPDDIEAGDGATASTSSCVCVLFWE